jgi:hypothetical protein
MGSTSTRPRPLPSKSFPIDPSSYHWTLYRAQHTCRSVNFGGMTIMSNSLKSSDFRRKTYQNKETHYVPKRTKLLFRGPDAVGDLKVPYTCPD